MFKAILFDMDGVLINTEPLHYKMWQITWKRYGVIIDYEFYKSCIGTTIEYLIEKVWERWQVDKRNNADFISEAFKVKKEIILREGYPVIPGVPEMIRNFHNQGYVLGLASSSPPDQIRNTLAELDITKYFSTIVSGNEVAQSKPAPDIFLKAAKQLTLKSEQCVVIEDSKNGISAAKSAGMACVAYRNPDSGNQDLSQADASVETWQELERVLRCLDK